MKILVMIFFLVDLVFYGDVGLWFVEVLLGVELV